MSHAATRSALLQPTMLISSPPTATHGLNAEQTQAFDELYPQLRVRACRYLALNGPAGTGKTFLAGRLAHTLLAEGCQVQLCAPTHQAAAVLLRKMGALADEDAEPLTIHALLGLQLLWDGKGGYHLKPRGKPRYRKGDIIICDEASMIGTNLWHYIEKVPDVFWLFLGDEAQLPPVNEDPSPALSVAGVRLKNIVRQARGNPIVELGRRVREGEQALTPDLLRVEDGQGISITGDREAMLDDAEAIFADPERDPYEGRILAFRNRVVNAYNQEMRERLYGGEVDPDVEGEWLVAHDTFFEHKSTIVKNSQMLQVHSAIPKRKPAEGGTWLVWVLWVLGAYEGQDDLRPTTVLDPSEEERYNEALREKADYANKVRAQGGVSWPLWKDYYKMREQFAQVRYGYAQTVHKAQGSTFDTAFVDWRDLKAASPDMKQALQYVAVTRPARRLVLMH